MKPQLKLAPTPAPSRFARAKSPTARLASASAAWLWGNVGFDDLLTLAGTLCVYLGIHAFSPDLALIILGLWLVYLGWPKVKPSEPNK